MLDVMRKHDRQALPNRGYKPELRGEQYSYQHLLLTVRDEDQFDLIFAIDQFVTVPGTWASFREWLVAHMLRDFRERHITALDEGRMIGPSDWTSFDAEEKGTLWLRAPHEPSALHFQPAGKKRLLMEAELWASNYSSCEALGKTQSLVSRQVV